MVQSVNYPPPPPGTKLLDQDGKNIAHPWRDWCNQISQRAASSGSAGTGTVTSVGLALPGIFGVTGSPVTGSGTLTASLSAQGANLVFAGPTSGSAAAPTFRALVAADVPVAQSIAGGLANQIVYQVSLNTSGFLPAPTSGGTFLGWTGSSFAWTAGSAYTPPASCVRLNTANGYGSTNTAIRRFTTVVRNTGVDITYVDSATLGATFTINTTGIYAISYSDEFSAASWLGLSQNSSQLTTNMPYITAANVLACTTSAGSNDGCSVSWAGPLTAADVIRAHDEGTSSGSLGNACQFTITRLS